MRGLKGIKAEKKEEELSGDDMQRQNPALCEMIQNRHRK